MSSNVIAYTLNKTCLTHVPEQSLPYVEYVGMLLRMSVFRAIMAMENSAERRSRACGMVRFGTISNI